MDKVITFKVRPDSGFYQQYFGWKTASKEFQELAGAFLAKYLPNSKDAKVLACSRLTVQMGPTDHAQDKTQILPNQVWYSGECYWRFKQKSPLNKSWFTQVYQNIDASALHGIQSWQNEFGGRIHGSRLWDEGDTVFGQISGDESLLKLPYWAKAISDKV